MRGLSFTVRNHVDNLVTSFSSIQEQMASSTYISTGNQAIDCCLIVHVVEHPAKYSVNHLLSINMREREYDSSGILVDTYLTG